MHRSARAAWNQSSPKESNLQILNIPSCPVSSREPCLSPRPGDQCNYQPLTHGQRLGVFSHELNWTGHKSLTCVKATRGSTWNTEDFSRLWVRRAELRGVDIALHKNLSAPVAAQCLLCHPVQSAAWCAPSVFSLFMQVFAGSFSHFLPEG